MALTVPMVLSILVSTRLPARAGDPDGPPSPWIHPSGIAPGIVTAFAMVPFVAFSAFIPLYGREIGLEEVLVAGAAVVPGLAILYGNLAPRWSSTLAGGAAAGSGIATGQDSAVT